MLQRKCPGTAARAPASTPIDDQKPTVDSRQVSWWEVHEFVDAMLGQVNNWPMAGTPAWSSLAHDDPRKWAALLDAAQHHALRVEVAQHNRAAASRAVAGAVDWPTLSSEIRRSRDFFADRPWLRRKP